MNHFHNILVGVDLGTGLQCSLLAVKPDDFQCPVDPE